MATSAAMAAPKKLLAPMGKKQLFLPNHVITFIRPRPKQPSNHAMFAVPLKWNKFDLRDYLFNVYNVEVRGVRSFINQSAPEKKNQLGKTYRPQSEKMMVAELVKPFVWPAVPGKDAREAWDYEQHLKYKGEEDARRKEYADKMKGRIPLRTEVKIPMDVRDLRKQAQEFLADPGLWEETGVKGGKWKEVETEDSFNFEGGENGELVKGMKEQEKNEGGR
ncbi:hypothetical protein B0T16DRAFT_459724 [Cercophora newfieldiana]|uniref:Large ribosomal subunit protein uL23m n=1 Tax=Cercophora newfieldiana TaxID=92897 RepID=A0AA40CLP8_9PEZI|nr:hypothetical protein B0T16DRAFT_459724 [Cercophora newfieldiana]